MRIAIDAMGGDLSPKVNVEGAVLAAKEGVQEVILVGDKEAIEKELSLFDTTGLNVRIEHASEVINMDETPVQACKQKTDSSVMVCAKLVANGAADAFVTAGNSGATMTSSLMHLKRIKGVLRPAIAIVLPTLESYCVLIDAGANMDCKPKNVFQFGVMGSVYINKIFHIENPKVGLLSIGEEDSKGNELTLETFSLLKKSSLNFIGNIEGYDIHSGKADVVACDGFIGNIVLKHSEGLARTIFTMVKREMKLKFFRRIGAFLLKKVFRSLKKKTSYDEHGGALLLGIDGTVIICHGSSNAKAIKNAIKLAVSCVKNNINNEIYEKIKENEI